MAVNLKIFFSVKIVDLEKAFRIFDAFLCEPDLLFFFFIVPPFDQGRHKKIRQLIQIGLYTGRSRNNKGSLRTVQKNRIRLINDHIIEFSQETILGGSHQIV